MSIEFGRSATGGGHLDEVHVKINGQKHYLWYAISGWIIISLSILAFSSVIQRRNAQE